MSGPARAALLISSPSERAVLASWLSGDALQVVEGLPAETDLVICNLSGLRTHAAGLSALRAAQHPRALPLILLLPRDVVLAGLRQDERVLVDDVIRVPVDTDELRLCVTYAIRMRAQSLKQEHAVLFEQRLVGVVGHDMRSPLQMLTMLGGLLVEADEALPPALRGSGGRLSRAAATLTLLADDLLLVAQGRAHTQLLLERVESDLAEAAERALQMLPQRERVSLASTGDTRARVDSLRVVQMLVNLLQNALRHGEATTPVEVSVNGTADGVSLSVSNGGTLDGEHVEDLFEAFAQGTTTKEARAGSGLGLYIVRMIASAHGGEVGVESHDGRVTFTVTLPRD